MHPQVERKMKLAVFKLNGTATRLAGEDYLARHPEDEVDLGRAKMDSQ